MSIAVLPHVLIFLGALIVAFLFFSYYCKTKDKGLLVLSSTFILLAFSYLIHLSEDIFGLDIDNWLFIQIDHFSIIIVLAALIWVMWPKGKWQKPIRCNRLH